MSDYLDINNEELLRDFFSEAEQQVEVLESNILVIEQDPGNHDAIDEIFRAAHTLKGGSATVEMTELAEFTHAMEDSLDQIRAGSIQVTGDVVDVLLNSLDVIKEMLAARADGGVYTQDVSPIIESLHSFSTNGAVRKKTPKKARKTVSAPAVRKTAPSKSESLFSEYELLELEASLNPGDTVYAMTVHFDESNPMNTVGGIQIFAALKQYGNILKTIPDFDALYSDVFHEYAVYVIASSLSSEELQKNAEISGVTLDIEITEPDISQFSDEDEEDAPSVVADEVSAVSEQTQKTREVPKAAAHTSGHQNQSILRVDAKRIDYLLNLVSETVITKASLNQNSMEFNDLYGLFQTAYNSHKEQMQHLFDRLPQYFEKLSEGKPINEVKAELAAEYAGMGDAFSKFETYMKNSVSKLRSVSQNLGRISGDLQEGVMRIRMVPISQIFNRFPRVLRDLSKELHKDVQLIIEGEDTELDKSVVEDLLDPIMHCVRNAIDHGIESPNVRRELGKSEQGTILLRASNEGNMIVIEIADDGHGIDVEATKAKAVERGLLHPNKNLTDIEAYQLVFAPGFSTAKTISNVSGRGVGLDVVKTYIEKLNGTVMIESQQNVGTRFVIKLPLTLAIIQGLLVRVGAEVYSIPIASVIESHRIKNEEINRIDNYEVLNIRDGVISLLRLNRLFGIHSQGVGASRADENYNYVVIVGTEEKKIGLMVDSLIGEEDVVIKPLKDQFTNSPGIAGASILGDGSVSLIIDVSRLLELGMRQEMRARERREATVW